MILQTELDAAKNVAFKNSSDVNQFFQNAVKMHFVDWFNVNCGKKGAWSERTLEVNDAVRTRFATIWDNLTLILPGQTADLLQFSAIMTAFLVETGAQLMPVAEMCGNQNYPGLTYPFDAIPGLKQSYNTGASNKPAGSLFFDDADFWEAHGGLAPGDLVRAMPDLRDQWNGSAYPRQQFNPSLDPTHSGFIQQADFFKFRGRGFVQVTWRANYKKIVQFVQGYTGPSVVVNQYKAAWTGLDPDVACTRSTNADWDQLFEAPDLVVACRAVGLHNESCGGYFKIASDAVTLAGEAAGSFYHVGLRINGGVAYAGAFRDRALQMLTTLAYGGDKPMPQAPTG